MNRASISGPSMLQNRLEIANTLCLSATQVGHTFDFALTMGRSAKHLGCCLFELVHSKLGHKPALGADPLRKCPEHCRDSWQSNGGKDKFSKQCLFRFNHHCSVRCPTKNKNCWFSPGRTALLLLLVWVLEGFWALENPASSVICLHPRLRWCFEVMRRAGAKVLWPP